MRPWGNSAPCSPSAPPRQASGDAFRKTDAFAAENRANIDVDATRADLVAAGSTYDFSIPGAAAIRAAVESALNGTIAALEPNIVGDGSTDGTGAAVVDPQAPGA
ncbi:MAG: hypothetical protein QOJ28_3331 [Mycobacterium sp.]|jgi:hypothetical protein|nr:hypothetical protein [Mycobacterium sp.]